MFGLRAGPDVCYTPIPLTAEIEFLAHSPVAEFCLGFDFLSNPLWDTV